MKLSFENLANSKLAVIPLYPAADWNNNQKDGVKSSDAARVAFKEVKLELRANPDDSNSLKYGMYFKVFDNGSPEQWCRWRDDLKRAWTGLGNTNGPLRAATVRHLLEGQALDDFEAYMQSEGVTDTIEHVNKALKRVAVNIFPSDAVTAIKQYLNFELTKPNKLSARATATRLDRINNWLEFFPTDGDDRVGTVPKLVESELRTIYYRLLPATWRRKMDESNGFLWHEASLRDIVEYAERLETTEQRYVNHSKGNPTGNADKKGPVGNNKGGNSSDGGPESGSAKGDAAINKNNNKDCLVHGDGCGHGSHKCKLLQAHAEKLRNQHKAQPHKQRTPFKKNNNYKNKPGEDRKYSRAEVQALMKKLEGKLTLENHNMEVDEPTHEAMVEEALEELFNDDKK